MTQAINESPNFEQKNHIIFSTVIRPQDLADMNMNGLQRIAEMIGIELGD